MQGLPMPRHPADGVMVKAQRWRQRRASAWRTPEGAGVQHASRRIDAPEGGCGGVQEQRSTTGYLKHNLVKIECCGETLTQTREERLEGCAAVTPRDTRPAPLPPASC